MNAHRNGKKVGTWFIGIIIGTLAWGSISAFAEEGSPRRWHTPEELRQRGELPAPEPILEVAFKYDADALKPLELAHLVIYEYGHAPQHKPLEFGYTLSLHSAAGEELYALKFQIPNRLESLPPQPGETPAGPIILRSMKFALTVPMVEGAVELRVKDPVGNLIIQESLRGVKVEHNRPNFRSSPGREASLRDYSGPQGSRNRSLFAWFTDLFDVPEAEAADGFVDIAITGDDYLDTPADRALFDADVRAMTDFAITLEPFASRASQMLFHKIPNFTVDLGCSLQSGRIIFCDGAAVTSVVNNSGAPHDKIYVVVKGLVGGSGGGDVALGGNVSGPETFVHECLGHSLGGLWDEYTLYPNNSPPNLTGTFGNCYAGTPPNPDWQGLVALADYRLGCSYPNWYRTSNGSIMQDLTAPHFFNAVSQRLINAQIDFYVGPPVPTLTFTSTPPGVRPGDSSTLSWSSTNATSCTASGGWTGAKPLTGSQSVNPTTTTTYTLTCTNAAGSAARSLTVSVDGVAPSVSLDSPANGATVSGTYTVTATATDNVGVDRVDFYVDGVLKSSDTTSAYTFSWDTTAVSNGSHTLQAKGLDTAGNVGSSSIITVTVSNTSGVSITSPTDGATISYIVPVTASLTGITATSVKLYVGGLQYTDTTAPYSFSWVTRTLTDGLYTLVAKAYRSTTLLATSVPVTVALQNVPITFPSSGATVSSVVTVTASVSSRITTVAPIKVAFFVDGVKKLTDTTAPYSFAWATTGASNGPHTLVTKGYKISTGTLMGTSAPVTVTVSN